MRRFLASPLFAALCGLLVIALFPLIVTNNYHRMVLIFIAIYTILAVGLNLLMGYAGQVSLGHAAFFGIGAYTSAVMTTQTHLSPWLAIIVGIIISAIIALLVGIPCLRLKGHYLAMATMGFGWIVYIVIDNWESVTKGSSGVTNIPNLAIGSLVFSSDLSRFYLVWVIVILILLISANLIQSRVGRALRALHRSENAAAALGVNIAGYKVAIFVLSAAYASLAGSLYAHTVNYISPAPFGFIGSVEIVVMVVVGGMASIWGAVIGAGSITLLVEWLRGLGQVNPRFQEFEIIVHGAILILVMIFMPGGLTCGIRDAFLRWYRQGEVTTASLTTEKEVVTK